MQKLRKLDFVSKTTYNNYKKLLYETAATLVTENGESKEATYFALLISKHLPWKDKDETKNQPMLYLGSITNWSKTLNKIKDKNEYAFGSCKVTKQGGSYTVHLCKRDGNLITSTNRSKVTDELKKYKYKFFLKNVSKLDNIGKINSESNVDSDSSSKQQEQEPISRAEKLAIIGRDLLYHHNKVREIMTKTKDAPEHLIPKLKERRHDLIKAIKDLCKKWAALYDTRIVEQLSKNDVLKWVKVYEIWKIQLHL